MNDTNTWLSPKEVSERFGVVVRTLDKWMARADIGFPRPVMLNRRNRRWRLSDVLAWENSRSTSNVEAAE